MRSTLSQLTLGALVALPLVAFAPAVGAMGNAAARETVSVTCTGAGETQMHTDLCTALRTQLSTFYPSHNFGTPDTPAELELTLDVLNTSKRSLTARLEWRGAATGSSNDLTVGVSDSIIGARQYDMLSKGLLKTAKLPLSSD